MTLNFTDHHIQDAIIFSLVDGAKRFSQLVPDGMEHSHLMYHMHKLIAGGLVEKIDQLYSLTRTGAQQYNSRFQLSEPLKNHKVLVQFIIKGPDDTLLLSRRTTAIKEQLTEYMLPGGAHFYMASKTQSAHRICKSRKFLLGEYIGQLETIAPNAGYHGIIDLFFASSDENSRAGKEHEHGWLKIDEVAAMSFEQAGSAPFIAERLRTNTLHDSMTNILPKTGEKRV